MEISLFADPEIFFPQRGHANHSALMFSPQCGQDREGDSVCVCGVGKALPVVGQNLAKDG